MTKEASVFFIKSGFVPVGPKLQAFCPRRRPAHLVADRLKRHPGIGFDNQLIMDMHDDAAAAQEALRKMLEYLTENEGIPYVTAWCASENIGSRRVLEKAGMRLVRTEKDGLTVGDRVYDKLTYEYSGT